MRIALHSASKLLDVASGKAENGTNIGTWENTSSSAQLFKFIQQEDGSYVITTRSSLDKSAVEIINASMDDGANAREHNIASISWKDDAVVVVLRASEMEDKEHL